MFRRVLHLLRHDPALLAKKLNQRIQRERACRREIKNALNDGGGDGASVGSADLLTALAAQLPLVVLERRPNDVCCGINAPDVAKAIAIALRSPARLIVKGEPLDRDPANLMARCCRAPSFTLALWGGASPSRWRFEIFERTEAGNYRSRAVQNQVASVLYGELFEKPGLVDLTARMPELARKIDSKPIDIVYTWVNSADPDWQQAFLNASRDAASDDAFSESRFFSNDELRYSLRSVYANLPWANTIHIVSNCKPPAWLDLSHPQLRWVTHEAILPADCLPTFNSHAIETSLHRIPGLAENFLYFNDDFLAFDAFDPSDFVNENGTLIANLEPQGVVNAAVDPEAPDYLNAARNSARLLYERFGYYPTKLHKHTPYSLSRTLLEALEAEFGDALERTRRARFRSIGDVNVASFLAHHYGFVKREVVYEAYSSCMIMSSDPFSIVEMDRLADSEMRPKIVCVNEGGVLTPAPAWRQEATAFMQCHFPQSAPWERPG